MHHPIRIRALRLGLAACLLAGALAGLASANAPTYETTILFTHDTHDHFLPMPDEEGGEYGGYTRLATLIQQERAAHPDALVLDAGDFSMGSLFQTIYATEAPELRPWARWGTTPRRWATMSLTTAPAAWRRCSTPPWTAAIRCPPLSRPTTSPRRRTRTPGRRGTATASGTT